MAIGEGSSQPKEGILVDINTGLTATVLTEILNVEGEGNLYGMYAIDPDNLAQNETVRITVDGNIIFSGVADVPNADRWLRAITSCARGGGPILVVDQYGEVSQQNPIPFTKSLLIQYLRAAAGATGLTINIAYSLKRQS